MKSLVAYCLNVLALLTFSSSVAQHINFKNSTVADGLPQSQVFDIEQDKNGALWLATQGGGVCIYDGKNFTVLDTKSNLPSSFVHTLAYYKEQMFARTHTNFSPWTIVKTNNKKQARLESIRHVLSKFEYEGKDDAPAVVLPDPNVVMKFHRSMYQID